jgi:hypothetical protein
MGMGRNNRPKQSPEVLASKERLYSRRKWLKKKYGITIQQYNILYDVQDGRCGICGDRFERENVSLKIRGAMCVDHDHGSGRIRGLLCIRCNTALERFDSVENFSEKVIRYLKER